MLKNQNKLIIIYCCKDCGNLIHFNTALHGIGICRLCSRKNKGQGVGNDKFRCLVCNKIFISNTASKRKFCCRKCYIEWQKLHPHGFKIGHKSGMTGKKQSEKWKKAILKSLKGHKFWGGKEAKKHWIKKGSKVGSSYRYPKGHIPWNAGTSTNPKRSLRMSQKYKEWRLKVFKRDNFTCQKCFKRGGELEAHHIKECSIYPELIFKLSNGQTLCYDCHLQTDNFGIKASLKFKQLKEI